MSQLAYRRDIDGLRSLAVLPVVFNHAGLAAFPGGFVGVDIFFVISGFLITGILGRELDDGRFSLLGFYERRARRILPALMVVLAACLVGGLFVLLPDELVRLAKSAIATLAFSSNIWFWWAAGDYFGDSVSFEPLLHTWSLAVEEQFYLFFPPLLWLLVRAGGGGRTLQWSIALLCLASFALSIWMTRADPVSSFYLVPTRIWELGIGALLAIGALPKLRGRGLNETVGILGLALIAGSIAFISDETPFPGMAALAPCLGALALIWSGGSSTTLASRLLSTRPLVWVGLISYSLYLWHWPVLVAARLYYSSVELPVQAIVWCIAIAVLLAWASWRFVEQPFRRPNAGLRLSRGQIFAASGSVMAMMAVLAGGAIVSHGLPSRLPANTLATYKAARERSALDDRCMSRPLGAAPCEIVPPVPGKAPDVVLWGDSHAGALLPGVEAWLRMHGLTGVAFTRTACAPLPGLIRADMSADHRCNVQNDNALAYVRTKAPGATVILASRWALTVEGARAKGEAGVPALLAEVGKSSSGKAANEGLARTSLVSLLTTLGAQGNKVILIAGVPELGFDGAKALARSQLLGFHAEIPTAAENEVRNRRADRLLEQAAVAHGAKLRRVADRICNPDCRPVSGQTWLYRDDDHLSTAGARLIIPAVLDE